MSRLVLLALVFTGLQSASAQTTRPSEIGLSAEKLSHITEYLQRECDQKRIAGAVAAVSRHGRIGYLQAVGSSDLQSGEPMQIDALFRIASMTKAITSAAVMSLVEDGALSLDDSVSKYLPAFKRSDGPAPSIHDLLTHRSGLTYGWFGPGELDAVYAANNINHLFEPTKQTIADRVNRIAKLPLKFEPSTSWDYGVSTDVLGRVVEVASGLRLDRFFKERFFVPLKMNDTFFYVPEEKQHRLASLYTLDSAGSLEQVGATPIKKSFFRFSAEYCTVPGNFYSGGGGLVSSTGDYLRFLHMLLQGGELDGTRVLKSETVEMMTKNQIGDMTIYLPGHGDGFGFGFGVVTDRGSDTNEFSVGSYSWGGIFNTYFWVDPRKELVGLLMTQVFPNDHLKTRDEFRRQVYAALIDSDTETPKSKKPDDKRVRPNLSGSTATATLTATSTSTSTAIRSAPEMTAQRLTNLTQFALSGKGNSKAGAKLFSDQRTKCSTCHRVGEHGGNVGPNLTNIGGKFDRPHLIDSLLYPSRQISYGYETTVVVTQDGKTVSGIAKESTEDHVTLLDSQNRRIRISKSDIEETQISKTSIMPTGLAESLSAQEFVDLVSYLETLGRGKGKFGSGVSGPVKLADGFKLETIATGLSGAVAMDIAPDGRIFVCEQGGTLLVIDRDVSSNAADKPSSGPIEALTLPVELDWERGLIGVTVAPDFPTDPHIYVVYVTDEPHTHHRVSRFRIHGNTVDPDSELILLRGDDQSKFGGHRAAGHQGGAIHFGPDGKLYIGIGEQTARTLAQRMDALQGKILRLNRDGSIPEDNPFVDETIGKYQAIWAMGCRNPFTFAVNESGIMFINDVGGKFEEINQGIAGANYGWPNVDHGPTDQSGMTGPVHMYPQSCINGGDFCPSSSDWPEQYRNTYFFADFNQGWVKYIDLKDPGKSNDFLRGIRRPVDIRFAPDGSLFILLRNAWVVDDKFEGGTGALIRVSR